MRLKGATKAAPAQHPHKPSIAILPFNNMSGDPEQEYFADGMVEEITTALSRTRWLFVIARNSSFTYKGRAVDVKQVGREMGVRYVLEGGVRKSADRVRITAQLIDASTGAHLWADRFDGSLEDIFELQDQVTASVVGAIAPRLEQAEVERAKHKPTESLDAYDYFLRGIASLHSWTKESNDEALRLFNKAIELDSDFASAYGMASWCYVRRKGSRWIVDRAQETAETARLARRAAELGWDDAVALAWGGFALAYVVHDVEVGAALIDRALQLNPNLAEAWHFSGWVRIYLGEPEVAIEHLAHAMRLSPSIHSLSLRKWRSHSLISSPAAMMMHHHGRKKLWPHRPRATGKARVSPGTSHRCGKQFTRRAARGGAERNSTITPTQSYAPYFESEESNSASPARRILLGTLRACEKRD